MLRRFSSICYHKGFSVLYLISLDVFLTVFRLQCHHIEERKMQLVLSEHNCNWRVYSSLEQGLVPVTEGEVGWIESSENIQ